MSKSISKAVPTLGLSLAVPLALSLALPLAQPALAQTADYAPYSTDAFPKQLLFGDTHVHTGLSGDAGGSGTRLMPDDAYRFARGEAVMSNTGIPVRLARPYDFFMITDHSDAMGAIIDILEGAPNIMADPDGRLFHEEFNEGGQTAAKAMFRLITQFAQGELSEALNYQPGNPAFARIWNDIVQSAERFNDPGQFTTFIAYEWTSLVKGNNLHRNVIFRDNAEKALQVVPFTTTPPLGSRDPKALWEWMESYERDTGGNVTAIPHNGNISNGMMFPLFDDFDEGKPLDAEYAQAREKWERLYEATQFKGDGEAHPLLSPDDEFADYETWDFGNLDATEKKTPDMLPGEYVRSGLLRGLSLQSQLGTNPFKFGLQGATDTHTGLSTPDEDNFFGKFTTTEPSPSRAMHPGRSNPEKDITGPMGWEYNSAGVTAVWSTANTREAIFDAMERREAYATTGPRIQLRFFGGWEFEEADAVAPDVARLGYGKGVPMGSDLPAGTGAPSFLIAAMRDPRGANLDRIQVVKGWIEADGEAREQVYNVAWSGERTIDGAGKLAPVGSSVTINTEGDTSSDPSWRNDIGASYLNVVWRDPDFDPAQSAFYYVRVLEIPTPRWTAYDQARFNTPAESGVRMTTQERAYSSPIWYTPEVTKVGSVAAVQ